MSIEAKESKIDLTNEIGVAAHWWADRLLDNEEVSEDSAVQFENALCVTLANKDNWFFKDGTDLNTSKISPCWILKATADQVGIDSSLFPHSTQMTIREDAVKVCIGEDAPWTEIYKI